MLDQIHKHILRFHIPMRDGQHHQVIQRPEQLVRIKLQTHRINLLLFYYLIEVVREIVHNDVQVLFLALIGEKTVPHLQDVRVLENL